MHSEYPLSLVGPSSNLAGIISSLQAWWTRAMTAEPEQAEVVMAPSQPARSSTPIATRLVLRYRSACDTKCPSDWIAGVRHFALDRTPLSEVEVSATGMDFFDDIPVAPGARLLVEFGIPGEGITWRGVLRVESLCHWTNPARADQRMYRFSTRVETFAKGSERTLLDFVERLEAQSARAVA